MARCALLSTATLLPAIVQHEDTARSGHVKTDAIALLLAFLRSSKVSLHSLFVSCYSAEIIALRPELYKTSKNMFINPCCIYKCIASLCIAQMHA